MDELVIKNAHIINKSSSHNDSKVDLKIKNGIIVEIGKALSGKKEFDAQGAFVTIGFTDLRSFIQDPGEEYKESFTSMEAAALAGGYTKICVHPYNEQSLINKQDLEYIKSINTNSRVRFIPIAACTQNLKSEDVTEMFDMKNSGALGFSNGNHPIPHSGVMNRIMQYVSNTDTTLFIHAQLDNLVPNWQVAEGENNLKTGLKGLPKLAESILVQRDLALAEYNGTKIHFSHISTSESVELIKKAKEKGINVTADVSCMHLLYDDSEIVNFDTNYKCNPPLRTSFDQEALIKGVIDGTIDAVCSDHIAQDIESKVVEFDQAHFGASTIQCAFSKIHQKLSNELTTEEIVDLFTNKPNHILKLNNSTIEEGEIADLQIFNPKTDWTFAPEFNLSKGINSPFINQNILGKTIAVFAKGELTKF